MHLPDRLDIEPTMIDVASAHTVPWQRDRDGCEWLYLTTEDGQSIAFWLQGRPDYCDRGHFEVHCDHHYHTEARINSIDDHDVFPRFYMSLEVARLETVAFAVWRLFKVSPHLYSLIAFSARKR